MIVGPTVRGPNRPALRRGDRVAVRVAVAGRTGLEGMVTALRPVTVVDVALDDGRTLGFYPQELRLVRRGRLRVDVCRCHEGHPAHGGAA